MNWRDWWRGYSFLDVLAAQGKIDEALPGHTPPMSKREMRAARKERLQPRPWPRIARNTAWEWSKCYESHSWQREFLETLGDLPPMTYEEMSGLLERWPA